MTEWHVLRKEPGAILLAVFLLCGGPLLAFDGSGSSGATRHEVIPLHHINPHKGKDFLARLEIGAVSVLPGTSALLVTAEPEDLQKAVALLRIVDSRTIFDIKELGPVSAARNLPSNERLAKAVGGVAIGTFTCPPTDKTKMRAIVDVHNGVLVAIAPVFQLRDIKLAVELGPQVLEQRRSLAGAPSLAADLSVLQAMVLPDTDPEDQGDPTASEATGDVRYDTPQTTGSQVTLPPEMQGRIEEMRRLAAELKAQREAVLRPNLQPAPVLGVDRQQVSSDLSLGQTDTPAAEPPIPSDLVRPGSEAQEKPSPEALPEPVEPKPVQPEPVRPEPVRPEPVQPEPVQLEPVQPEPVQPEPVELEPVVEEPATLSPGQIVPPATGVVAEVLPESASEEPETRPTEMVSSALPPVPSYEPADLQNADRVIDLTLPERLPVIQLLDLVGKYLDLDYIYDPAKITGEVTLKLNGNLRGQMKVKDLYLLLESVLKFRNLVMTRHKGNIVTIVPAAEALDADPMLVGPDDPSVEAGDVVVTRVFTLEHISTSSADNLLQSMRLSVGTMPIAERRMLIVTAYAYRMARIQELLRLVDRPGEPRVFRYRQLRYTLAGTLAEKIKALAEQLENVTVTVADPTAPVSTQKLPTETDAQYRTRLAQIRAAQAAAARARATASASRSTEEKEPGVYLDADERTNRILMIGIEKQLVLVEELVEALDVEQQDLRALQLYRMTYVDAEEVARKLAELGVISRIPESSFSTRITGGSRTQVETPGQLRPRTTPAPTSSAVPGSEVTEEGLVGEPQVVVVESTNSLLVNATPEQHAKIAIIIEYVDSQTDLAEIPYQIYQLKNSSPAHLSEILENLIQETIEQDREGKIEKTVVRRDEKIRIVPDPNTYSLIVYANKKNQEWIANLVEQLDRRRPQVLIDVTLVEITEVDSFNYELGVARSHSDPNRGFSWGGALPNFVNAFYADHQVEAILSAVKSKTYGRVLAKPKLLVNDNEQGIISRTDTKFVEVTSAIPVTGGAAGTQENLIQTSVNFDSYETGITLDITPHISEGDLLRLDVMLERSDFGEGVENKPPDTSSNQVDTTVTVPDGSTVILGGMLKMKQQKGGAKVPILGDIPLIGGLFRRIENSGDESKLYVFVKAEIIRPADTEHGMKDLDDISERNRMAFERHELEWQKHQDWPGVKPETIDPPKVLDAQ